MGAVNVSVPPEEEEEEEEAGERGEAASGSDPGVSEAEARVSAALRAGRVDEARVRAGAREGTPREKATEHDMARWAIAKAAADRPSGRIDARTRTEGARAREG
jgi:hypothetical protein